MISFGRNAAADGFVLYTSEDGEHWDEGTDLGRAKGASYYSNNIVLDLENGAQRVLIQASTPYSKGCVNIAHWTMELR